MRVGTRIEVPPVYCPIAPAIHPDVADLETRGLDWMARHGFCDDPRQRAAVVGCRAAEFFARISPEAHAERLQIAVDWCYLFFLFDNLWCDEGPGRTDPVAFIDLGARMMRTLEAPDCELLPRPLREPLRDLVRRARRLGSAQQLERIVDAHRRFIAAVAWGIACQARGASLSLSEYAVMRLHACGGPPVTAWIEISNDLTISEEELTAPRTRALTELAWTIAAWDNDLVSFGKERWLFERENRDPSARLLNLVEVLAAERHCSIERAMEHAVALRDRLMGLFLRLRDGALLVASPALERYVGDLGHLLRGNFEWSLSADRYRHPDDDPASTLEIIGGWATTPSDERPDPVPIPGMAWWWGQLQDRTVGETTLEHGETIPRCSTAAVRDCHRS